MSLLIVGSASKITQNIVHQLARNNVYKSITITDLLPTYCFHSRYYQLKKSLVQYNSQTTIDLNKLTRIEELYRQIQ